MGAMSAASGPLGVALIAIGAAWFNLQRSQQRADEATDQLTQGLVELGTEYRKAALAADNGSATVIDSLKRITSQNEDLQRAVITLTQLGVGLDDIAGAASGSAVELDRVLGVINSRIVELKTQMEQAQNAADENGLDLGALDDDIRRLEKMRDKFQEAADKAHVASDAMKILNASAVDLSDSTAFLTPQQRALAEANRVLGDQSATTEDKIKALSAAQDAMRKATIDAVEAEESWYASLDQLKTAVGAATEADDKHARSLSVKTATGRANRDMLEGLIESANRMYDADVALNGVTQKAIDKGQNHIKQIRDVAKHLGLNKTETDKLVNAYKKIPESVETTVTMDQNSFQNVYKNLQRMQFMQSMLRLGKSGQDAEKEWLDFQREQNRAMKRAGGGPISGPGTGTSDDVLLWGSNGEYMQPTASVDYYGLGFMEALRRRAIPKEVLPGFSTGGQIGQIPQQRIPGYAGGGQVWPYKVDVSKTFVPNEDQITAYLFGSAIAGALGNMPGGRGWKWQMSTLRKRFKGLPLYSGYRPGARTPSGNVSWHARGRAVDLPPRREVFNFIHDTFGKKTLELIWLGDPNRNIQRGKHHRYSASLLRNHGVAGMPNAHIHWAYDQGGMLPPGYTSAFNGTGKPEAVLTNQQWQTINQLAETASSGTGSVYQFEFRDTTLDAGYLRALQEREAVLARSGRAR
jgi:hypothetical protein